MRFSQTWKFRSILVQKYECVGNTEMAKVINLCMKQYLTIQSKISCSLYRSADRWHRYPVRTQKRKKVCVIFLPSSLHVCTLSLSSLCYNVLLYSFIFCISLEVHSGDLKIFFSQLLILLPVTFKFDISFKQQYVTEFLLSRKSCSKLTWRQKSIRR